MEGAALSAPEEKRKKREREPRMDTDVL